MSDSNRKQAVVAARQEHPSDDGAFVVRNRQD
jgi:hypothetical protein